MGKIRIENNFKKFMSNNENLLDWAIDRMAYDMSLIAKTNMPAKEYTMSKSTYTQKVKNMHYKVVVNTDYASYQERGQREDGTKVAKKYTTPGTGKGFLEGAGNSVSENALNYLKQAASLVKAK